MPDIIEPGTRHQCILPDPDHVRSGTLARCAEPVCGRWHYRDIDYTYWAYPRWHRVRWWNRTYLRRIRHEEEYDDA